MKVAELFNALRSAQDEASRQRIVAELKKALRSDLELHPRTYMIGDSAQIFEYAVSTIGELAEQSLAGAVALVMHYYPLCALHTVPLKKMATAGILRRKFVSRLQRENAIIGNTGGSSWRKTSVVAERDGSRLVINGAPGWMSLADVADYVFVRAIGSGGENYLALVPMMTEGVELGSALFNDGMRSTLTKPIKFVNCTINSKQYVTDQLSDKADHIADFQRIWFHMLTAYCYGQAVRTLLERMSESADGKYMARGAYVESGKAHALLTAMRSIVSETLLHMSKISEITDGLDRMVRDSSSAKLLVSMSADYVSQSIYYDLGARAFLDPAINQIISDLRYIKVQPLSDGAIITALNEKK